MTNPHVGRIGEPRPAETKPSEAPDRAAGVPPHQQALRARCVHPRGGSEPFAIEAIEQTLTARFELIARRYPDRLAVKGAAHSMNYEALNRAANQIAHAVLDRRGDRAEPVALLMAKDAPMVAAELGLLKAGKTYVPLDPTYPEARLASVLTECGAPVVLTETKHRALADTLAGGRVDVLDVDALDGRIDDGNPGRARGAAPPAHILYTSGSTGRPKGVVLSHRTVLHHVMRFTNVLHIGANDRFIILGSMSSGQAVSQIFTSLMNGAAVLLRDLKETGLADLAAWINSEGITCYRSSASIFRRWVEQLDKADTFPTLRLVGVASEPVFRHDFELYQRHFAPPCLFVNALSSTETGMIRMNVLDHNSPIEGRLVPVGYAVDDVETLLLDEKGNEVGADDVGEIAIRSRGLANGYWGEEELTRERFRPHPNDPDVRTYLLGDVGRFERDGALVHLGRSDARVKIRGQRIELGEVEAALSEVESIRQAVVVDRDDHRGEKRLVAYVVPNPGAALTRGDLRRALKGRLPSHMIPFAFVFLDELPRAPSGKVDRRALPTFASPGLEPPGHWTARLGLLGTQISTIWEQLLGVTAVNPSDDFLELGGDSLLAMEMLARIEQICGRAIAPSRLLESAITIERLVDLVLEEERASWGTRMTAVQSGGGKVPLFFAHGDFDHGGLYCRRLARELGPDQPFYSMTPHGLDGGSVPWSIEAIAADHLDAIRAVRPSGPYRLGGFCNGAVIAFEMARQLEKQGQSVESVLLIDGRALNAPRSLRFLSRLARLVARARRWSEPTRRAFFLKLRLLAEAYGDSARPGGSGRVRFVLRKLVSIARRAFVPVALDSATEEPGRSLISTYGPRLRDYVPGRLRGRVVLFRSSHLEGKPPGGPTAGWGYVARQVDVHAIPGNHQLAVTRHVTTLAEKMKPYLS
jgi:amino acid adenylation domain-containing protein